MEIVLAFALLFKPETEWTAELAADMPQSKTTVVLWDLTRPDIVTPTHAIEVEFAKKWAQSVGQSLHYADMLNLKPMIIVLMQPGEERFVYRLRNVCKLVDIKLSIKKIPTQD